MLAGTYGECCCLCILGEQGKATFPWPVNPRRLWPVRLQRGAYGAGVRGDVRSKARTGVEVLTETAVLEVTQERVVRAVDSRGVWEFRAASMVLGTGC